MSHFKYVGFLTLSVDMVCEDHLHPKRKHSVSI